MNGKYDDRIFRLMKIIKNIKTQISGLSNSVSRYPMSTLLSFLLFILLVMLNERSFESSSTETLERLALVTTLGFFFSVSLTQLFENLWPKVSKVPIIIIVTIGFMTLYYFLFIQEMNTPSMIRFGGTLVFLVLTVIYSLKIKDHEDYERYVMKIFSGFFITFLYAFVVFLGISFIILTINALFDANIDGKWYLYTFYASTFLFGTPLLLSKLPRKEDEVADTPYSRVFRALLLYILLPLILVYTLILYVYFIQILVTMEWPQGLVSNLVLWYAAFSVGVIFFIHPLRQKEPLVQHFKTWFPRILLPILVMMFVSIGKRINQYGVTESRYYVVLLGLFVFIVMAYFAFRKISTMIYVPILLSVFVFISVYGPGSALSVSYFSQNQRLTSLLTENNMLIEENIIPKSDITKDDQKNIASIANFFLNRDIRKMKYVEDTFTQGNFSSTFGFSHISDYDYGRFDYYYISSDIMRKPVLVKGYDYLFTVGSYQDKSSLDGYSVELQNFETLVISKDNKLIFEEDLSEEFMRILTARMGGNNETLSTAESIINTSGSDLSLTIYLQDLAAQKPEDGDFIFENISLIVLFTP